MQSPVIKAKHAFTTRFGGMSTGSLASLNLGENRGDDRENVRENYRRIGLACGVDTGHMAFTRQVHGREVKVCTEKDVRELFTPIAYEADGLVTDCRGLGLICYTADCVPLLLCDDRAGVIGAVHCGWRSSVLDIPGAAIEKMCALGARAEDICAAIGPSIGYCCFEVGAEVIDAARDWLSGELDGLCRENENAAEKYFLDLRGANRRRLLQLGLKDENISVSDECTMCRSDKYWSHRITKGDRGSQAALIMLD